MKTLSKGSMLFLWCGILACASVFHWLLFPDNVDSEYRNVYHMISSIQGFLSCLVAACCFYFIPKVTDIQPPGNRFWLVGFLAPSGVTLSAWLRFEFPDEIMLAVSMICWILLASTLLWFCYPLFKAGNKKLLIINSIWLWSAIGFGIIGTSMVSTYSTIQIVSETEIPWLLFLGRGCLLQGMFFAVYMAIIPIFFTNQNRESKPKSDCRLRAFAVIIFSISFPIEFWLSARFGFGLRAVITIAILLKIKYLRRFPNQGSLQSSMIWLSAWMIPLGYMIPVLHPDFRDAGLHVVFLGGFTTSFFVMILFGILKPYPELKKRFDQPLFMGPLLIGLSLTVFLRIFAEFRTEDAVQFFSISAIALAVSVVVWMFILLQIFGSIKRINPLHSQ